MAPNRRTGSLGTMVDDDTEDLDDGAAAGTDEQDVVVHLRLSNRQMGTAGERTELEALAAELEDAVLAAKVGEYDGDEVGGGECLLFFAGPDADRLFAVLAPLLKKSPLARGARVRLQLGDEIVERSV